MKICDLSESIWCFHCVDTDLIRKQFSTLPKIKRFLTPALIIKSIFWLKRFLTIWQFAFKSLFLDSNPVLINNIIKTSIKKKISSIFFQFLVISLFCSKYFFRYCFEKWYFLIIGHFIFYDLRLWYFHKFNSKSSSVSCVEEKFQT